MWSAWCLCPSCVLQWEPLGTRVKYVWADEPALHARGVLAPPLVQATPVDSTLLPLPLAPLSLPPGSRSSSPPPSPPPPSRLQVAVIGSSLQLAPPDPCVARHCCAVDQDYVCSGRDVVDDFCQHYAASSLPRRLLDEVSNLALGGPGGNNCGVLSYTAMGFLSSSSVLMLDALGIGQLTFTPFAEALRSAHDADWQVAPMCLGKRLMRAMCVNAEIERLARITREDVRQLAPSQRPLPDLRTCEAMCTLPLWVDTATTSAQPHQLLFDTLPKPDDLHPLAVRPSSVAAQRSLLTASEISLSVTRSARDPSGRLSPWGDLTEADLSLMQRTPVWSAVRRDFARVAFGATDLDGEEYTRAERVAALVFFTAWNGVAADVHGAAEAVGAQPLFADVSLTDFWSSLEGRLCNFHANHWIPNACKRFLVPVDERVAVADTVPLVFRRWNLTDLHNANAHLWLDLALAFSHVLRVAVQHLIDASSVRSCIDGNADTKLALDAYILGALSPCPTRACLLAYQRDSGKGWDGTLDKMQPHPLSRVRRKVVCGYGQTKDPYKTCRSGVPYVADTQGRMRNLLVAFRGFGLVVCVVDVVVGGGPKGKAGQCTDLPWTLDCSYCESAAMMVLVRELLELGDDALFVRRTRCAYKDLARVQTLQASDFTDLAVCAYLYFRDLSCMPGVSSTRTPTLMRHCIPLCRLPPCVGSGALVWPPNVCRAIGLSEAKYLSPPPIDVGWVQFSVPALPCDLYQLSRRVVWWRAQKLSSDHYKMLLDANKLLPYTWAASDPWVPDVHYLFPYWQRKVVRDALIPLVQLSRQKKHGMDCLSFVLVILQHVVRRAAPVDYGDVDACACRVCYVQCLAASRVG